MSRPKHPHPDLAELVHGGATDPQLSVFYGVCTKTIRVWRKAEGLPCNPTPTRCEDHGTTAQYAHGCRCEPCTKANTLRQRGQQSTRRERTAANGGIAPVAKHGSATGTNWGCRCDTCVSAVAAKNRADNLRRKAMSS